MLISQQGIPVGSVSGGCVEEDLLDKFRQGFFHSQTTPLSLKYGEQSTDNPSVRIPCGSTLEILVERIHTDTEFKQILDTISQGKTIQRCLDIKNRTSSLQAAPGPDSIHQTDFFYDGHLMKKTFGPSWRILLIGASPVSASVIHMARLLGYHTVLCEPRKEYLESWDHSLCPISHLMPDEAVRAFATESRGIVLGLSHDARLDDMALMVALEMELFYVGAMGSRRSSQQRRQRLLELGLEPTALNRLHAPVGLDISSKRPAEIALSIFAEITALRAQLPIQTNSLADLQG